MFTIWDLIHLKIPDEASQLKKAYYAFVVGPAARRAFSVITSSEYSKGEILQWARIQEERVQVVSPGVSSRFTADGPQHRPGYSYILYVGNQKPHKNVSRLLQAVSIAHIPRDVRLLLSGDPQPHTMTVLRELGLEDRVAFAGTIPDESLPSYYRGAICLVLPSLYEGFGLPPVEAMACGTPVIASGVTSLPEVIGQAGLLVDPLHVESIAAALESVVTDEDLRAELSLRGLQQATRFRWDDAVARVNRILEDAKTA